jgi:hypothetical protein
MKGTISPLMKEVLNNPESIKSFNKGLCSGKMPFAFEHDGKTYIVK